MDEKFDLLLKHTNDFLERKNLRKFDGKLFTKKGLEVIRPSLKQKYLETAYKDPTKTANGRDRFYFRVRQEAANISHRDISEFLKKQENYQLHYIQPRQKILKPSTEKKINMRWQMDLIDMSNYSRSNQGRKYVLTVIDCFSKFAFCKALKSKSAEWVLDRLRTILEENKEQTGEYPKLIQSDNGSEFIAEETKALLKRRGIKQIFSPAHMPQANGQIERFNRTLKRYIYQGFLANKNNRWYDYLHLYTQNYNNSFHSTIKDIPANIHKPNKKNVKQQKLVDKNYNEWFKTYKNYPELKVGDTVRIHILTNKEARKDKFTKKYLPQWSRETYKVAYIEGKRKNLKIPYYYLERLERKFYRHDLQKI